MKQYISELNAVRKIDITKLWPDLDDLLEKEEINNKSS